MRFLKARLARWVAAREFGGGGGGRGFAGNGGGGGVRNKPDVRTLHVACLLMARDESRVSPVCMPLGRFGCPLWLCALPSLEKEAKIMHGVQGWKVGESVYNSTWMPPASTPYENPRA